jgi:hypothetical protein
MMLNVFIERLERFYKLRIKRVILNDNDAVAKELDQISIVVFHHASLEL